MRTPIYERRRAPQRCAAAFCRYKLPPLYADAGLARAAFRPERDDA